MDVLAELESMVINASVDPKPTVSEQDITRWQGLFNLTAAEAISKIEAHRSDLARLRISDALWADVQQSKEAEGFDREAYEYSLTHRQTVPRDGIPSPAPADASGTFLVQLTGPLDTAEKLRHAASLSTLPAVVSGTDESGVAAYFCEVDGTARANLLAWLSTYSPAFKSTIVRLAKAKKDLCSHSLAPALGLDATMPQNRMLDPPLGASPALLQDQYPVLYFFYGTLCSPKILGRQLGLNDADPLPELVSAYVLGGKVRTWAGKYKALVDAFGSTARVQGKAFVVEDREQEDALRFYETDKYEVVRCGVCVKEMVLPGLTFRFCGLERELDLGTP